MTSNWSNPSSQGASQRISFSSERHGSRNQHVELARADHLLGRLMKHRHVEPQLADDRLDGAGFFADRIAQCHFQIGPHDRQHYAGHTPPVPISSTRWPASRKRSSTGCRPRRGSRTSHSPCAGSGSTFHSSSIVHGSTGPTARSARRAIQSRAESKPREAFRAKHYSMAHTNSVDTADLGNRFDCSPLKRRWQPLTPWPPRPRIMALHAAGQFS